MRPIAQVGLRTTAWTNLGLVAPLTKGSIRVRWSDGRPEMFFVGAEWPAGSTIPWSALPADFARGSEAAGYRSVAQIPVTNNLTVFATVVVWQSGFALGAGQASPGSMQGIITWPV